jgi:DNA-binding XRE family transcriptional regulator
VPEPVSVSATDTVTDAVTATHRPDLENSIHNTFPTSLPSYWLSIVFVYLRQRAGLSQTDIAKRMDVSRSYINKIENHGVCPTLGQLERYTNALGTTPYMVIRMAEFLALGE